MNKQKPDGNNLPGDIGIRHQLHEIIFEADTWAGVLFDVLLLVAIVASIVVVCLETVPGIGADLVLAVPASVGSDGSEIPAQKATIVAAGTHTELLSILSWAFTIFFTIEYAFRLFSVRKPSKYAFSFWGIIDLLSFLPDYLLLVFGLGAFSHTSFSVIRSLRLLRVFRIFKLSWFQYEAEDLGDAIWRARAKIVVFLTVVMIVVTVMGTLMYEVEHVLAEDTTQFTSIPVGIYWAIVTMTTVGFGDVVPVTTVGKFLSAILILIGYSLIIVPTGFVSAEIIGMKKKSISTISCASCVTEGHDEDAVYCKYCGDEMHAR